MDEDSYEDGEEAAEIQRITREQFAIIGKDKVVEEAIAAMQRRIGWQQNIAAERRRVFTRLVEIGARYIANPFFLDAQLSWLLVVINNAHAVPLPEDRGDLAMLATEYLEYYAERIPRPAWIPESYVIAAHEAGAWGEMAVIGYPMTPGATA